MANQRWAVDKNIKFIKEYQRNECLWDPKHPQYKNRVVRESAYREIMKTMELNTVREVVTKIRILRNTYNNELLKSRKTDEMYVSKIPWLSHMDFLKNIERFNTEKTPCISFYPQEASSESNEEDFTVQPTPSTIKRKLEDPLLRADNPIESVPSLPSQQISRSGDAGDEFGLFGLMVAQQLRQLPLEDALETEEEILATIRRRRMKILQRNTSSMSECMESRTFAITKLEYQ